ncbi:MAG: DUF1016 domain-containing protein [Elusimicrobia bacterium]|nr:DUF1016 domain-containing protein [Elusimicrobiota bacterium]
MDSPAKPAGYGELLERIKSQVRTARIKLSYAANRGLITLYWNIGRSIVERQKVEKWGQSVVERLGRDLQKEFPGQKGLSPQNIWHMRGFYLAWSGPILPQAVGELDKAILKQPASESTSPNLPRAVTEIPWGHNITLFERLKTTTERLWYARKCQENGWSRSILVHHIESGLHKRQGKALTNFQRTLPPSQAERAQEVLQDSYNLDFIALEPGARERDVELGLIGNVSRTLLALGAGFAFVGRQVALTVGNRDYILDLLFYNLHLRCYFVIELKAGEFKPEHVGKIGFYMSAVDDQMRHKDDQQSIGIIMCRFKNRLSVEYALRDSHKPIGVATYTLTKELPKRLRGKLPSADEIEAALDLKPGGQNARRRI